MVSTHAYLSALVLPDWDATRPLLRVKAHTFSAALGGWTGERIITSHHNVGESLSVNRIRSYRNWIRENSRATAGEYSQRDLFEVGLYMLAVTHFHGENFPTWVGDFYIQPVFAQRGRTRTRSLDHYLVTEAPGLDCGHWEEDELPLRGS